MLLILHGDNHILSRATLYQEIEIAKTRGVKDIVRLDGRHLSLNPLIEACETGSLFGTDRLVIIDSLHSCLSKKTLSELTSYLSSTIYDLRSIILWESKPLTPTQLKKLANFNARLYKTSKLTFKFLDCLLPGKARQFLLLFSQACQTDTPEFVFFMLARELRLLLQTFDPNFKLPPWQQGKLQSQARAFGQTALVELHDKLQELDWRLKTGQTVLPLSSELSFLLSTL